MSHTLHQQPLQTMPANLAGMTVVVVMQSILLPWRLGAT
jgi:hypothetical protein